MLALTGRAPGSGSDVADPGLGCRQLLRVLQGGGGRPSPLGRTVVEVGRFTKTMYPLAHLDDETYRRRILTRLNRTESRHALARPYCTVNAGNYASATAKVKKTSSAPSASSTPSCCRTPATRTPSSISTATTHQPPRPLPIARHRPHRRPTPTTARPRHTRTCQSGERLAHDPARLLLRPRRGHPTGIGRRACRTIRRRAGAVPQQVVELSR